MNTEKDILFDKGQSRIAAFLVLNPAIPPVQIERVPSDRWRVSACAYWRASLIKICVEDCAGPGRSGQQWSWPGYAVDRTPYGVLAHEFGHHVDYHSSRNRSAYWGEYSGKIRQATGENQLTSYCPDDAEWFAEHFRLFITNPDLLKKLRPVTFMYLSARFKHLPLIPWEEVLRKNGAPDRTIQAAANRVRSTE